MGGPIVRHVRVTTLSVALVCLLGCAGVASAHPVVMPTIAKRLQQQPAIHAVDQTLTPGGFWLGLDVRVEEDAAVAVDADRLVQ
jgi:hypothetical protein